MRFTILLQTALIPAFSGLLLTAETAAYEVRRHDRSAEVYQPAEEPGYLINMPHEGSAILVAPDWVASVAHNVFYNYVGHTIEIDGVAYTMEEVVFHPNWRPMPEELGRGDAAPLMVFLESRADLVLIRLSAPVAGRRPIAIYNRGDEVGQQVEIFGRGAKGDGLTGELIETKAVRRLGYFHNVIDTADNGWLRFDFDPPGEALDLEGTLGSGDSGGPSVVYRNGEPLALGLNSWRYYEGDLEYFQGGLYGSVAVQVRLSAYHDWIHSVIDE